MSEGEGRKPVYVGLRARYIVLFGLVFLVLMAAIYGWFVLSGVPLILQRATTAFDISAGVSNVALDQPTVHTLRENFVRALETQVWHNLEQAGVGLALAFFAVSIGFISLTVAYAQRNMAALTGAARQVSEGNYDVDLSSLYNTRFQSEISELARAVEASGRAHLREQKLQVEVAELKIEIDHLRRDAEVEAIVETDNFKELRRKAAELRRESAESDDPPRPES
jgi:hypothetical protein